MELVNLAKRTLSRFDRRSVSLTAGVGIAVQLARPLVSLLTLPLLLGQLGQAGLGVWMIALSLMGLIGTINAGLSISLVTSIGRADQDDFCQSLHRLSTAATVIAAMTAISVLLVSIPIALVVDWAALLDLSSDSFGAEVSSMMVVLAVLLGISIIASVPRQIIMGRMHGYVAQILDFIGLIAGATSLIIGILLNLPLWLLALAFMGPPVLITLIGGLLYLRRAEIPLFTWCHFDFEIFKRLGLDSLRMVGYQGSYSISSQSDLFLIGVILGAPASAVYGVAQRIFSLPIMMAATVNYAQWPAIARADAAGEQGKIRKVLSSTLVIGSAGATTVAVVLAFVYQPLLHFWLGDRLVTAQVILVGMVLWVAVATLVNTCDMVLRARNETKLLARAMMIMAVINIATTLALLPKIGPAGAIFGSVFGYTLALLLPFSVRLYRIFREVA